MVYADCEGFKRFYICTEEILASEERSLSNSQKRLSLLARLSGVESGVGMLTTAYWRDTSSFLIIVGLTVASFCLAYHVDKRHSSEKLALKDRRNKFYRRFLEIDCGESYFNSFQLRKE